MACGHWRRPREASSAGQGPGVVDTSAEILLLLENKLLVIFWCLCSCGESSLSCLLKCEDVKIVFDTVYPLNMAERELSSSHNALSHIAPVYCV